jgi:hypothetical protein
LFGDLHNGWFWLSVMAMTAISVHRRVETREYCL